MIDENEKLPYAQDLLAAVKKDDVKLFEQLTSNRSYLALCFGRFPLLSVCYLFKSDRIIKKFGGTLAAVSAENYIFDEEDEEAFKLFRKKAKKSLRFYVFENRLVNPPEMLAVLGKDVQLKADWEKFNADPDTREQVVKIYKLQSGQKVEFPDGKPKLSRRKLAGRKKALTAAAICFVAVMLAVSCAFCGWTYAFPKGTESDPIYIDSVAELNLAFVGTEVYALSCDLTLDGVNIDEFTGTLDGKGHTLYINNLGDTAFIATLSGKICNVNVVFGDYSTTISEDGALFVLDNNGTLSSVNITANLAVSVQASSQTSVTRYFGVLVGRNYGTVSDCTVNSSAQITGVAGVNTLFALVAGLNMGTVSGCITTAESTVVSATADIAGIAAVNASSTSTVSNCTNNATLSQTSAESTWSPNVGGLVCTNKGTVEGSANNGGIYSASTANSSNVVSVYSGGIVCINYNLVSLCKNTSTVSASGETAYIYVGGIAAYNYDTASVISACGSDGVIIASTPYEASENENDTATVLLFGFAGGIAGANDGYVVNCFSSASYTLSGDLTYAGGIIGLSGNTAIYSTSMGSQIYYSNNYYLTQSNADTGIATYLYGSTVLTAGDVGTTSCATLAELQAKEVYWQ